MTNHFTDALAAIAAATTQADLNATYAAHMTRLTLNDEPR